MLVSRAAASKFRSILRSAMPLDRRCVKSKWVFKVKRNGVFRARLVACGYSQIPGGDFTENYSPVVHDITFRTLLLAMLLYGYQAKIVDVETAFLYGELEEAIYMEEPPSPPEFFPLPEEDAALELGRCIYGLVQAARQLRRSSFSSNCHSRSIFPRSFQ